MTDPRVDRLVIEADALLATIFARAQTLEIATAAGRLAGALQLYDGIDRMPVLPASGQATTGGQREISPPPPARTSPVQ